MLFRVILFLGLAIASATAADPPGFVVWPGGCPRKARLKKFSSSITVGHWPIARRAESSNPTVLGLLS
jgi:hypothetical protein